MSLIKNRSILFKIVSLNVGGQIALLRFFDADRIYPTQDNWPSHTPGGSTSCFNGGLTTTTEIFHGGVSDEEKRKIFCIATSIAVNCYPLVIPRAEAPEFLVPKQD